MLHSRQRGFLFFAVALAIACLSAGCGDSGGAAQSADLGSTSGADAAPEAGPDSDAEVVDVGALPVTDAEPTALDAGPDALGDDAFLPAPAPTVAGPSLVEGIEDEALEFVLTATGGRPPLTLDVETSTTHGTLNLDSNTPPVRVTFRPDADYFGPDEATFVVRDLAGVESAPLKVDFTLASVNDAPVAVDDPELRLDEGATGDLDVLANDRDVDLAVDERLILVGVTQPEEGILALTADGDALTFTPTEGMQGPRTLHFEYTVSDAAGASATAAGTLEILAVPQAPTLQPVDPVTTDEDVEVRVAVVTFDPDPAPENAAELILVTPPAHGLVELAPGEFTYHPEGDYFGPDAFELAASDGLGLESAPVTVEVEVHPVNDPPVAGADLGQVLEAGRTELDVLLNDTDVDSEGLFVVDVGEATFGTTGLNIAGQVVYTAADRFVGPEDAFTYVVADPEGAMAEGRVSVRIFPRNDAPEAVGPDSVELAEDTSLSISLTGLDQETPEAGLTVRLISAPAHGRVPSLEGPAPLQTLYTPAPNFFGADELTFIVVDQELAESAPLTVRIVVRPENDLPEAVGDRATTDSVTSILLPVLANDFDVDNDTLRVRSVSQPPQGQVDILADGQLRFTPRYPSAGPQPFDYTIEDGQGGTATAEILVEVTEGQAVEISRFGATPGTITAGEATNVDWQALAATGCSLDPGGLAVASSGRLEVRPADSQRYTLTCQGPAGPANASVDITVLADTDGDHLADVLEVALGYDPENPDSDGDDVDDGVEDPDGDGVGPPADATDTLALDADTDDDGLSDGLEDLDGDGLVEPASGESDPRDPDSDDDGLCDFVREDNDGDGIGPPDPCVNPLATVTILSFQAAPDLLIAGESSRLSWSTISARECTLEPGVGAVAVPVGAIDVTPLATTEYTLRCDGLGGSTEARLTVGPDVDTDGDGFVDGLERRYGYDPDLADSDLDGLLDGVEDADRDGLQGVDETSPVIADTDEDGLLDGEEDLNFDRHLDAGETDPLLADTDGDGVPDGVERRLEIDPRETDSDDDGLPDGLEVAGDTEPGLPDSDGDGRCDAFRVDEDGDGLDPVSPCVGSETLQGTWFVQAGAPPLVANGLYWDTAFATVQAALDAAAPGERIFVSRGVYRPTAAGLPVATPRAGQRLYGGFLGREATLEARPAPPVGTVLSGDASGDGQSADDAAHVVVVSGASDVVLNGFVITGGNTSRDDGSNGAGVRVVDAERFLGQDLEFASNRGFLGAGFGCDNSGVALERTRFTGNIATDTGAGLHAFDGCSVVASDLTAERNRAVFDGGALAIESRSSLTLSVALLRENKSDARGGGLVLLDESNATLTDVRVLQNTADSVGAGVAVESLSRLDAVDVVIADNRTEETGGGISLADHSALTLHRSVVSGNRSVGQGGGVYAFDLSTAEIESVRFEGNVADFEGGGVSAHDGADVRLFDVHFRENSSDRGGALYAEFDAVVRVLDGTFEENEAFTDGGAVAMVEAEVELAHCSFAGNRASYGGAAYGEFGKLDLINSVLFGQVASEEGREIYADEETRLGLISLCGQQDYADDGYSPRNRIAVGADPFERAASGEVFLRRAAPCVGRANLAQADRVYAGVGLDARTRTNDRGGAADGDDQTLDPGAHHALDAVWITSLGPVAGATVPYGTHGASECHAADARGQVLGPTPLGLPAGQFLVPAGTPGPAALTCTGVDGKSVATVNLP